MIGQLRTTADALGLPFVLRTKTYNSRLAQELGLWAEDQGRGDPFHLAAFHAYFAEGVNLAKIPVLLDIAKKVGLDEVGAKRVLTHRTYKDKVDRDWADSRLQSINAVPTLIMGQRRLVGAQNYENLVELVTYHGATKKKHPE